MTSYYWSVFYWDKSWFLPVGVKSFREFISGLMQLVKADKTPISRAKIILQLPSGYG